jgi:putative ABC transport system permease protein
VAWLRRRSDADFAEEIRAHLALEADALAREGVREPDLAATARRSVGNLTAMQERFYESRRSRWIERIRQDFLGAVRQLRRSPGFALTAILTLALGIGLSTSVFAVANAVLIRRLPVAAQNRLILLWGESQDGKRSKIPLTLEMVHALQRQSRSLESAAFFAFRGAVPAPIRAGDRVLPIQLGLVSGGFFEVLGSKAEIGRELRPEDDVEGAAPVVVLSYRAWKRDFGGDPAIVGKSVSMIYTNRSYTIVGVMPIGLEYPSETDIWAPLVAYGAAGGFLDVLSGELNVIARLHRDASSAQARAELTALFAESDSHALGRGVRGAVQSLPDTVLGNLKPAILLVSLVAALLLFITCVNVANLLFVRALSRSREFALRSAIGANRGRLVSQLLAESCLLSVAGGLAGVGLAMITLTAFVIAAPNNVPRINEIHLDGAAIIGAILITSAAMLMSGVGPALFASGSFDHGALPSSSRHTGGRRLGRLAEGLVVAQITLAAIILVTAGLVTRSLMKLESLDLSFDPRQAVVTMLAMSPDRLSDAAKQRSALDLVVARVRAIPGVKAVAPVMAMPFIGDGGGVDGRMSVAGQGTEERTHNPIEDLEVASPDFFATLRIPLLRGRWFAVGDRKGAPPVIVISSSVANHFWPGSDPIGKQLVDGPDEFTVVGVVPDTRYRDAQIARPAVYFPIEQWPDVPTTLFVRVDDSHHSIAAELRRAIAGANDGVAVVKTSSLEDLLATPRAQPRLNTIVLVLFAFASIILAAIGLYAIVATRVRQRTQEFGIRMALGATPRLLGKSVVFRALVLAVVGTTIGVAGALSVGRLISALLFGVDPADWVTLLVVASMILGVAAIASWIPARLTIRVNPVVALRREN